MSALSALPADILKAAWQRAVEAGDVAQFAAIRAEMRARLPRRPDLAEAGLRRRLDLDLAQARARMGLDT